jgi:rod shape-determining protein MreD
MPAPSAPKQVILLPVNPWFIGFTLVFALLLNLMPLPRDAGVWAWVLPDWVAITLVFWNIQQPRRVGMLVAWMLGLAMDVNHASLLGQHALGYTVLSYLAITLHRRVRFFGALGQLVHVLPLLLFAQLVVLAVRLAAGGSFPGMIYFASGLAGAALWPIISWIYLAPQRQPPEKDENRPI